VGWGGSVLLYSELFLLCGYGAYGLITRNKNTISDKYCKSLYIDETVIVIDIVQITYQIIGKCGLVCLQSTP